MANKKKGLIDSESRHKGYMNKAGSAVDSLMNMLGGSKKKKKKKSGGPKLDKKKVDKFDLWGK